MLDANIKMKNENVTPEKKAPFINGISELSVDVIDKNPSKTVVIIDEVDLDN